MKKRLFCILLTAVLLISFGLMATAAEKPYVAEYLFDYGTISQLRSKWVTDGEYLYANSYDWSTVYKVDIATGEEMDEMETEVYYNGKYWNITYATGLHYNPRNETVVAGFSRLERENALSGSTETLSGNYAVDITNQRVLYKQTKNLLGIFSNGDILEMVSYSSGTQKAKRMTYPNYTSSSNTYTFYDVSDTGTDYGIVNVNGTEYLLNSSDIFRATGGYPTCSTYGNIVGAGSSCFVMLRNADVLYFTSSGTVLDQFSLDDVEEGENVGSVFHSKIGPLLVSDNGDIVYADTEWDQFCKISKRPVGVTGVSLNKTSATLSVGDSTTLTATVLPSDATNKAVTWESSDASVATVSNGTVTAKAAGTATITVTTSDGGYTDTCAVTVTKASTPPPVDTEGLLDYGEDDNGIGWYLYENGLLRIAGNGDMQDYASTSAIPWYPERENISEVVIEDGVTGIGERAFYNCSNLEKITIPASVLSIGTYTFRNCDSLRIWGEKGSYADEYAKEWWYPFNGITNMCVDVMDYDTEYLLSVTDMMDEVPDGAFVYAVLYNRRGKILSVGMDSYEYGLALPDVPKKAGGAYIKVFTWDAVSLKPLAYEYEHWLE